MRTRARQYAPYQPRRRQMLAPVHKQYRPNDTAKKHRLPDNQAKSEKVVSYTRRKA